MKLQNDFKPWLDWFEENAAQRPAIDWAAHEPLSARVRKRIAGPVRLFQLGESSDAERWIAKSSRFAVHRMQPHYYHAVQKLVGEENLHAKLLGEFLDREEIPRAHFRVTDSIFRTVRHALPLPETVAGLLAAELIAIPFYTALKAATPSVVLRQICAQILDDEALHLRFQAHALCVFRRRMNPVRRALLDTFLATAFQMAIHVVWFQANDLLLDGGYDFPTFSREASENYRQVRAIIRGDAPLTAPLPKEFDERRLFLTASPLAV